MSVVYASACPHHMCGAPSYAGKTLIARQIGKMLNGKEPKIVNGPEILNKYVGASEENVRNLFKASETCASWTRKDLPWS